MSKATRQKAAKASRPAKKTTGSAAGPAAAAAVVNKAATNTAATRAAAAAPKMEARTMADARRDKEFYCWNCDAFQPTDPAAGLGGQCRKKAPRCACALVKAEVTPPPPDPPFTASVSNAGGPAVWPLVNNGFRKWCLEWTLSTDPIPPNPLP